MPNLPLIPSKNFTLIEVWTVVTYRGYQRPRGKGKQKRDVRKSDWSNVNDAEPFVLPGRKL